jgi:hypothetical protein
LNGKKSEVGICLKIEFGFTIITVGEDANHYKQKRSSQNHFKQLVRGQNLAFVANNLLLSLHYFQVMCVMIGGEIKHFPQSYFSQ